VVGHPVAGILAALAILVFFLAQPDLLDSKDAVRLEKE
jgi:hypothetical protein